MNTAIATQHRNKMYALIDSAATTITVRPPATRAASTNATEKVFGPSGAQETDYGTPTTVSAWVHQAAVPASFAGQNTLQQIAAGKLAESDIILSLKLEDALVDANQPYGRTIFDTAKDVQIQGSTFQVKGTFRSGFAPLGPYILWVGLVNAGE